MAFERATNAVFFGSGTARRESESAPDPLAPESFGRVIRWYTHKKFSHRPLA